MSAINESFAFALDRRWRVVSPTHPAARALADRHYSRQTVGATEFMGNGRKLVLLTEDHKALWGAIENLDPRGGLHWRNNWFRNEGTFLSSDLIREATDVTYAYWERHYGGRPRVPLTTEVDPKKTRRKRDPGRCFTRAGWRRVRVTRDGLIVFQAP